MCAACPNNAANHSMKWVPKPMNRPCSAQRRAHKHSRLEGMCEIGCPMPKHAASTIAAVYECAAGMANLIYVVSHGQQHKRMQTELTR